MFRRLYGLLKPLGIAIAILAILPCVIEFAVRFADCRSMLASPGQAEAITTVPSWHTHHELTPLQNVPIKGSSAVGERGLVEFRTNSFGLRGGAIFVPRPPGVFRIICLGDEIVLGAKVAEQETLSNRLCEILQRTSSVKIEVINAGVPDYCPLLSTLQLRHRLLGFEPNLIIAHFDPSDVDDDRQYRRLTDLGDAEQPLLCSHPQLTSKPKTRPLSENFASIKWSQRFFTNLMDGGSGDSTDSATSDSGGKYSWLTADTSNSTLQLALALSAWDHLGEICDEAGIELMTTVHPTRWQVSENSSRKTAGSAAVDLLTEGETDNPRPFDRIHEFTQSRGLVLCDVTDAFMNTENPDELFEGNSRELSEAGHRLYAEQLAAALHLAIDGPWRSGARSEPDLNPAARIQRDPTLRQASGRENTSRPRVRSNGLAPISGRN